MGKSTHFIGQPLYSQVIKLLDKSKILQISQEKGGEHYTKRFTVWIHLIVMLYAVIKRFDSLREITTSLLADTNKLAHIGITFKIGRSTLADANKRRSESIFKSIYRYLYFLTDMNLYRTAGSVSIPNGWIVSDHRFHHNHIVCYKGYHVSDAQWPYGSQTPIRDIFKTSQG